VGVELTVGTSPTTLPPHASSLRAGARVSYWWDESFGWASGSVAEVLGSVAGELQVVVRFDSDGSEHRCGYGWESKARWRNEES
jgi:hypothetical protein